MKIMIILLAMTFTPSKSFASDSIIEKFRPFLISIIGEEKTSSLIGIDPNGGNVKMPILPKIDKSATSLRVYEKGADSIKVDPEIEAKFNYVYVLEVFQATRLQNPNENEIAKTMNVLSQGGTRAGVYRSLVLDETYGGMENWPRPVKKNTAEAAIELYSQFLNREFKLKNFEGMSVFTLKRIITENFLEMLDAFDKREDAESWYALVSANLAKNYSSLWQNEVRKNTNSQYHKEWASKVPFEHMKSELIIKLHTLFNSIN